MSDLRCMDMHNTISRPLSHCTDNSRSPTCFGVSCHNGNHGFMRREFCLSNGNPTMGVAMKEKNWK